MGFLDNAKKKAAETAELARHKAEEAAELARIKMDEGRLSELYAAVSGNTGRAWKCMAESVVIAKDSTIDFIHRKISDTVKGMDLQETIEAIRKAGKEQSVNVATLVKFMEASRR